MRFLMTGLAVVSQRPVSWIPAVELGFCRSLAAWRLIVRRFLAMALILGLLWTEAVQAGDAGAGFSSPSPEADVQGSDGALSFVLAWTAEGDESGDQFGFSVATAGDVDGDGDAEFVVGAPVDEDTVRNEGIASLFYGSPATWRVGSSQFGSRFGNSVATAGDVDGDGYADIIVGAYRYRPAEQEPEVGAAYLFPGSAYGLSATPSWTVPGPHKEAEYGFSVATAGDVNGDGFDDVIVGARYYAEGQDHEGAAYVYYGSETGPGLAADWFYASNQADAHFGSAVGTAGDVNGDGYSDVVVGAPMYNGDQTDEGAVLIFCGSASGLSATPDRVIEGDQEGGQFGASVAGAGDVNGDGYDDIAVGAPHFDTDEEDVGTVFVYHGSAAGPSGTPDWTAGVGPTGSRFGDSVGTAGDVNGDGYADLIVGAPGWEDTPREEPLEGGIFVFLGSSGGLAPTPAWKAEGDKAEAGLGHAVSTAGDVNTDGVDDIMAGAPDYRHGELIVGRAFLFCSQGNTERPFSVHLPLVVSASD
jgi:hypothetical protein